MVSDKKVVKQICMMKMMCKSFEGQESLTQFNFLNACARSFCTSFNRVWSNSF